MLFAPQRAVSPHRKVYVLGVVECGRRCNALRELQLSHFPSTYSISCHSGEIDTMTTGKTQPHTIAACPFETL